MQKRKKADIILAVVCVAFLMFMMATIVIRCFTSKIIVQKLGVTNRFTDIVFCDNNTKGTANGKKDNSVKQVADINGADSQPFNEEATEKDKISEHKQIIFSKYSQKIKDKTEKLKVPAEAYATEKLFGYQMMTAFSKSYESLLRWNFTPFEEYNNFVKIGNNYFYGIVAEKDVSSAANSTIEFSRYCRTENIDFLYVQMPSKISKYEDKNISGVTDFSNQNADAFLKKLKKADVKTFDLREEIHKEGLIHHSLFFETDHHWKGETGLWAAGKILEKMKSLKYNTNPKLLLPEKFDYVVYKDWFLGSQGKKATLAKATPEDISLIYPKDKTQFHYVIPNMGIDKTGDFSITYMMDYINEKDYMGANPYAAFNHADQPLIKIENELTENDNKVLIIHNSYANCVIPFMALGIKNVDSIDLRYFNDSVKAYVKESKPDIVIVTYPCDQPGPVDYSAHTSAFDFR